MLVLQPLVQLVWLCCNKLALVTTLGICLLLILYSLFPVNKRHAKHIIAVPSSNTILVVGHLALGHDITYIYFRVKDVRLAPA